MKKNIACKVLFLIGVLLLNACSKDIQNINFGKNNNEQQLYSLIEQNLKKENAIHLEECNCMKAFYRNLFHPPDNTARYVFDRKVGAYAPLKKDINVLIIGSGKLLNELTAVTHLLARKKNVNLYLVDYAYILHDEKDFNKKVLELAENPDKIPQSWKDFYIWSIYEKDNEEFLPFFEKHHNAINQFKKIIKNLDMFYKTKTTISILEPPKDKPIKLSNLDMIISIDSFLDIPNLMWNLFYQYELKGNKAVKFLALNKAKPLGGFWQGGGDKSKKEKIRRNAVSIGVYDIVSREDFGSYQLIEQISFIPNEKQLQNGPSAMNDDEVKQNPLVQNNLINEQVAS